jgi:hypothetical protein
MDDIFNQFFQGGGGFGGGFGGHGHGRRNEPPPPPDPFENTDVYTMNLGSISRFYRRQEIWIIIFMNPADKTWEEVKEEYKTLSSKMFGIFGVGAINCGEDEELCEDFQVYSTTSLGPTIKIFTEHQDSDEGEAYKGKKTW